MPSTPNCTGTSDITAEESFPVAPVIASAIAFAIILFAVVIALIMVLLRMRTQRRERKAENERVAFAAMETTRKMRFPACFVRAADFLELGELKSHESLRASGKLVYRDTFEDVAHGDDYIVFISHQWLGFDAPDSDNAQYPIMCHAVHTVAAKVQAQWVQGSRDQYEEAAQEEEVTMGRVLRRMLVWVDYSSIPQICDETLQLAIQSLSAYCSLANAFVICAPDAVHEDTMLPCNFGTYNKRMWCRAEQLCHILRNGDSSVWLSTGGESCQRLATPASAARKTEEEWLHQTLCVFDGDCSSEMDKLSLIAPILGLYAELYACRADEELPFLRNVLAQMMQSKDDVFPRSFVPKSAERSKRASLSDGNKRQMSLRRATMAASALASEISSSLSNPGSRKNSNMSDARLSDSNGFNGFNSAQPQVFVTGHTRKSEHAEASWVLGGLQTLGKGRFVLFGDLVETTERLIDEDEELRLTLRKQVLKRRGVMRKRSSRMLKRLSDPASLGGGSRRLSGVGRALWQGLARARRPSCTGDVSGGKGEEAGGSHKRLDLFLAKVRRDSLRGDGRGSARGDGRSSNRDHRSSARGDGRSFAPGDGRSSARDHRSSARCDGRRSAREGRTSARNGQVSQRAPSKQSSDLEAEVGTSREQGGSESTVEGFRERKTSASIEDALNGEKTKARRRSTSFVLEDGTILHASSNKRKVTEGGSASAPAPAAVDTELASGLSC